MIRIVKKKNKIREELLSKIEWACSLNSIKLEHIMIYECCLRIIEQTNLAYVEPHVFLGTPPENSLISYNL